MCRSIKTLRRAELPASDEEIRAAALQFVRKVSGYRTPSRANAEAFDAAVGEISESSRRLLAAVGAVEGVSPERTRGTGRAVEGRAIDGLSRARPS